MVGVVLVALDIGSLDTGSLDTGSLDAGSLDAGFLDAGSLHSGSLGASLCPVRDAHRRRRAREPLAILSGDAVLEPGQRDRRALAGRGAGYAVRVLDRGQHQ